MQERAKVCYEIGWFIASDSLEIDNDVLNTSGFPFSYKKFNISDFFFQHKDLLYKKKDELKRELSLIQQEYEKEREMVIHINILVQIPGSSTCIYFKIGYLRVGEIFTSYMISYKLRKISLHICLKHKILRVINHTSAYLIPTDIVWP